jgi:AraC-like DNA-binding protein
VNVWYDLENDFPLHRGKEGIELDVLLVIHQKLGVEKYNRFQRIFRNVHILDGCDFSSVRSRVKEHPYQYAIFATGNENLPRDWDIDILEIDRPKIVLLKMKMIDLIVFLSFLESVGLLAPTHSQKSVEPIHPLLSKSLVFIEENLYDNDLSLHKVASSMYVNRSYYSRMFREQFGKSFKEFVMQKRIEHAKAMLQEGRSVTDVCYAVGYGDLTHFGRVFKRFVGVNPSVYRREKSI